MPLHVNGLDVSTYQGNIDWGRVKANGYSFAIAKATEGTGEDDDTFAVNHVQEIREGMIAGAYHFMSWAKDPAEQAEHFLSIYTPRNGDLPPTLDCEAFPEPEGGWANASAAVREEYSQDATNRMATWIAKVETRLGGGKVMIYTDYDAIVSGRFNHTYFTGHPLWLAAYNSDTLPPYVGWNVRMWQYADNGRVDGIKGNVDLDRFYGSIDDLRGFCLQTVR